MCCPWKLRTRVGWAHLPLAELWTLKLSQDLILSNYLMWFELICLPFQMDRKWVSRNVKWTVMMMQIIQNLGKERLVNLWVINSSSLLHTSLLFVSIIIIIWACCLHGFPWLSRAIRLCRPLRVVGLPGGNQCPHKADECKFLLADPHSGIHVWASIGERRWWVRPRFSSSVQHVEFFSLGWFVRWEVDGHTAAVL